MGKKEQTIHRVKQLNFTTQQQTVKANERVSSAKHRTDCYYKTRGRYFRHVTFADDVCRSPTFLARRTFIKAIFFHSRLRFHIYRCTKKKEKMEISISENKRKEEVLFVFEFHCVTRIVETFRRILMIVLLSFFLFLIIINGKEILGNRYISVSHFFFYAIKALILFVYFLSAGKRISIAKKMTRLFHTRSHSYVSNTNYSQFLELLKPQTISGLKPLPIFDINIKL